MASLNQVVRDNKDVIKDGIAWVMIWKSGRSWNSDYIFPEDGSYDDGYVFDNNDMDRIEEVLGIDHKAIIFDGYHYAMDDLNFNDMVDKILYFYENRMVQLSSFNESYVIR